MCPIKWLFGIQCQTANTMFGLLLGVLLFMAIVILIAVVEGWIID
jgi:hypothetical protein